MVCFSADLFEIYPLILAGYDLKNALIAYVRETFPSFEPVDLGTHSKDSVDYPIFGHSVGKAVVQEHSKGVVVCGTGIGISIAANKVPGVRCALCHDVTTAKLCREVSILYIFSIIAFCSYIFSIMMLMFYQLEHVLLDSKSPKTFFLPS